MPYPGYGNQPPTATVGEYMSRLNARRNCEAQTGEVFYPTCKETATITYDAVIDSCNNGAIGGSAIGALALALGGKILSAAPVLSFTGGFGWITIGVGVLAAGYATHQVTACRDHAGRDLADNISWCVSKVREITVKACGNILSYGN